MRTFKIALLVTLGIVLFGSVGFFSYEVFLKPYGKSLSCSFLHRKKSTASAVPALVADPSLKDFETAIALQQAGKLLEAQQAWQAWLQVYPNAIKKKEVLEALGKINMDQLCSSSVSSGKEAYIVVKGDSLDRIARKKKSNAELIQKVNGLSGINLQIGETLLIPQLEVSLEIDRQARMLTLHNYGVFFKSYPLLSMPPASSEQKSLETVVVEKMAMNGNKRMAFGDKKYPESQQVILLRSAGSIVTTPIKLGVVESTASAETMPIGFVLAPSDMREIFPFISRNTPVVIH